MNLFQEQERNTAHKQQIERIRKGIIQKSMIISHSTTSADKARILMINELLKN